VRVPDASAARPDSRPALDPSRLPDHQVEVVDEAGSTNALVAERARSGAPEGLVVVAEHQTAGRGRLDRSWETPPRSGLTFSVLLRPPVDTVPAVSWPWLPLLTGHAVSSALRERGFDAAVKWPNDVLIGERKVAGILVERVDTTTGPAAVVGIGVNVGMTADELPVPEATSLALHGEVPDRTDLLGSVLDRLWDEYVEWTSGEAAAAERLLAAYVAGCATVGRDVTVALPGDKTLTGRASGIGADGSLLVDDGAGTRHRVSAGDVVHVRDAARDR
jgi:BirA family transcriptional regulator, biotin operon repressor / biotin---[acetyl-CoA-carboxylase] ligase